MPPETPGEAERVAYEIRQCFRVTGLGPAFSVWSSNPAVLAALWDALRPNVETRAFEESADRLRAEAVRLADGLDRLSALGPAQLGESQAYQAEAALMLQHYLSPKLLLFASAVSRALREPAQGGDGSSELIERGAPARMAPLELVEEGAAEPGIQRVFKECRRVTGAGAAPLIVRALALWPRYLESGWERLRAVQQLPSYRAACDSLLSASEELSAELPHPVALSPERLAGLGADAGTLERDTIELERALPAACLDVALLGLDWQAPEILRRSPFPARARGGDFAEVL